MGDSTDVVIIGGGLAGLAAACELKARGVSFVLLESSRTLGGKAGNSSTPSGEFPLGPSSFNGRHASFWRLLRQLGIENEAVKLEKSTRARWIVRGGKLEAIRPNPLSVLTTQALTWRDKLNLAKDMWGTRSASSDEDESLDSFLERRFGRATVDHFLAAVFTGIFAGDLKKLSAASCMPALVTAEREYGSVLRGALKAMRLPVDGSKPGLYTFPRGFGVIGSAATKSFPIRCGVEVSAIQVSETGLRLNLKTTEGQSIVFARQVIVATEAFAAAPLLSTIAPSAAKTLENLPYAPLTLLQWVEKEPGESKLPLGFGYLAAPIEKRFELGTVFVGDLTGERPRRFSTFIGGGLNPERAALRDLELTSKYTRDLHSLTGGKLGDVVSVVRWPRGVFQPPLGHLKMLTALKKELEGYPITLAGSYLGGAAMKDALASGFSAAEAVATKMEVRS